MNLRRLAESASLLRHRGPDHEGIHADHGAGLVHTRLSLLDLNARSNQPLWDAHGRYGLVYNGEIYNFGELRSELERESIEFTTTSDTEVLLKLILARGISATVTRLEGMFAFALYDKVEQSLVLARDRFGIKPLYVYDQEDLFIFASEIQAMRPWIKFEPDLLSISGYLQGHARYRLHRPTNGCSFFKQIRIVAPGSIVTVRQGGRAHYKRYFSIGEFCDSQMTERLASLKPALLADELEERLLNSIRLQLLADTPVGAFCSGGIDSSLVAMPGQLRSA